MYELLERKLKLVIELREMTEQMVNTNVRYEEDDLLMLTDKRKKLMDEIDILDCEVDKAGDKDTKDIKKLKREIGDIIKQIIDMDKIVRKSVNVELDELRPKVKRPSLNAQNDFSTKINIKA